MIAMAQKAILQRRNHRGRRDDLHQGRMIIGAADWICPVRNVMRASLHALPVLLMAACVSSPAPGREGSSPFSLPSTATVAEGRLLARIHCAGCHAAEPGSESAHEDAPSLRLISRRYPVASLEESLGEGIVVGHPDMPEYRFRPEDVSALIAYLETIQD